MSQHAPPHASDAIEPVLNAVLNEALVLTEEIVDADGARRAAGRPDRWESAARLRLAARLARIAAWASAAGAAEPERRAAASAALSGAAVSPLLDLAFEGAPRCAAGLAELAARVDRLASRALRLEALIGGCDEPEAPAPRARPAATEPSGRSAAILRFQPRPRGAESASGQT